MNIQELITSYKTQVNALEQSLSVVADGKIGLQLQETIDAMKKKLKEDILKAHTFKIWKTGDGLYWKTYLPDPSRDRGKRLVTAKDRTKLESVIVAWYLSSCDRVKTFDEMYWLYRRDHDLTICDNTIHRYDTDYERFFRNETFVEESIDKITADDIRCFIYAHILSQKLCSGAIKDLYQIIGAVFKKAYDSDLINRNPMDKLRGPKEFLRNTVPSERSMKTPTITADDWLKIWRQIEEDERNDYMPAYAIEMLCLTANRVGEISAFRWDMIVDGIIKIRNAWELNRKTNRYELKGVKNKENGERDIPVTEEIQELLDRIRKSQIRIGIVSEWVFADARGCIMPGVISSAMKNKCIQLKLPVIYSLYHLRKTCNSVGKMNGMSDTNSAFNLGNSVSVNNKHYTHDVRSLEEKKSDFEKMSLKRWASEHAAGV